MDLCRYTFADAYILGELRRDYRASDAKGRIRLLRKLYKGNQVAPFDIALLAVEDPNIEVRQWIARHGKYLDYREGREEHSNRNLEDRLRNDPDPFVRACLRENPTAYHGWGVRGFMEHFREATHIERLALMRNPEVGHAHGEELIQRIFDYEDQQLGIDVEARRELVLAFLTNTESLNQSRRLKTSDFIDGLSWVGTRAHFSKLWTLISKWPKGTGNLQHTVYRYVGAPDETKAEIYRACVEPVWRQAILENCDEDDIQTIDQGMQDTDGQCRELAYKKFDLRKYVARAMTNVLFQRNAPISDRALTMHGIPAVVNEKLQSILQGEDKAALSGLAENRSLPVDYIEKVRARLGELGDDLGVWSAKQTIQEVQKTQPPEAPEELFAQEGRKGKFLEDKIDFLGTRFLSFEREVTKRLYLLLIGVTITIGVALLVLILK